MSGGVSHLYRPEPQPAVDCTLICDDSYYLLQIHDAQAFFPANLLQRAQCLLFSSSVESSFRPGQPTQSLYKLIDFRANTAYHLGKNINLTDWLPARATDTVRISCNYHIKQATPIKSLVDKIETFDLKPVLSALAPQWEVALQISLIAGKLLSFLLSEGTETETFSLTMDLNLANLQAGYYAVLGSSSDEAFPSVLELKNGSLTARGGRELSRYSYIVLSVQTLQRRGLGIICEQPWGEMLQACKDEILLADIRDEDDRREAFQKWLIHLQQVRRMARQDKGFLQKEIDGVVAEAQQAVEEKLRPPTQQQAYGLEDYADEWQDVLRFSTPEELRRAVRDYQDAVELSERLLKQYQL